MCSAWLFGRNGSKRRVLRGSEPLSSAVLKTLISHKTENIENLFLKHRCLPPRFPEVLPPPPPTKNVLLSPPMSLTKQTLCKLVAFGPVPPLPSPYPEPRVPALPYQILVTLASCIFNQTPLCTSLSLSDLSPPSSSFFSFSPLFCPLDQSW